MPRRLRPEPPRWRPTRRSILAGLAGSSLLALPLRSRGAAAQETRGETAESWQNWSRAVSWNPQRVVRATEVSQIQAAVREAAKAGAKVRASGTGHSFVPIMATDDTFVLLSDLNDVGDVADDGTVWVGAGAKLYELNAPLREQGWALSNLPDIDRQSTSGAIATATHGTGLEHGSLSTQVVGVELIDGNGELVTIERSDAKRLRAARVALGALGLMTKIQLQLVPQFRLHEVTWIETFEAAVDQLEIRIEEHDHFEFFWVSDRDACLFKSLDRTDKTEHFEAYDDETKLTGQKVGWSGDIFPSLRNTRFNEIEYSVPLENGIDCWREIRELMMGKHKAVTWPLEYRTVKADDAFLSPMQGRDTVTLSLHQAAGVADREFFHDAESIFRNHQGRPHWGKMHWLESDELRKLYPHWEAFAEVRRELDPKGTYLTSYLASVLGS